MEFLSFLIEWGTIIASAVVVAATVAVSVLGASTVIKAYVNRKNVSQ